jgi:hypothetical protein
MSKRLSYKAEPLPDVKPMRIRSVHWHPGGPGETLCMQVGGPRQKDAKPVRGVGHLECIKEVMI